MIKLYHFERSGNSREVRIVLAEKGLAYKSHIVEVIKGEGQAPEFLKLNPFGKVPVIDDNGLVLYETRVINEYLDEAYPEPPLMPKSPAERAEVRKFMTWAERKIQNTIAPVLLETLLKPEEERDKGMIEMNTTELRVAIEEIDRRLEGREYACGDYSLADASVTPHLAAISRINVSPDPALENYHAWMKRIRARPSFRKSAEVR